jgi:hypothetical protein
MPVVIDDVSAQVVDQPEPERERSVPPGRQPPDMTRIQAELRREAERIRRLWCD